MKGFAYMFAALAILFGCERKPIERIEWTVMGTVAAAQTRGATAAESARIVHMAKDVFARVEKLLNAHDPSSELSRLAPLAEADILARCDAEMRPCYAAAFKLSRESGGAFNPRWRGADTIDLGAIAKGFALDLAAAEIRRRPPAADVLLDLGGNLISVRGEWHAGIRSSDGRSIGRMISLASGEAVATSAEYFRGKHIYDGRTHVPVTNGIKSVTVHSTSAMTADGLSTAIFVLGPDEGRALVRNAAIEGVLDVIIED